MPLIARDAGGRDFSPTPAGTHLEGFDIFRVLGAACQVVVQHEQGADGKTYANLTAVVALPRGVPKPTAERPLLRYSRDEPGQLAELPAWLQQKIHE